MPEKTNRFVFLGKRTFSAKDSTPLAELTLLSVDDMGLVQQIMSIEKLEQLGFPEPSDAVLDITFDVNGFKSVVSAIKVVGTASITVKK